MRGRIFPLRNFIPFCTFVCLRIWSRPNAACTSDFEQFLVFIIRLVNTESRAVIEVGLGDFGLSILSNPAMRHLNTNPFPLSKNDVPLYWGKMSCSDASHTGSMCKCIRSELCFCLHHLLRPFQEWGAETAHLATCNEFY